MRSSIACIRCRRSKVRCVNNGVGTACRSCENSGRDCQYPDPLPAGPRPRESFTERSGNGDNEEPPRPKKRSHTSSNHHNVSGVKESPRPMLDPLDSRLLTPTVWQELFDIFQIHYSADLPFLHPPTFLKPLRYANLMQTSIQSTPAEGVPAARPPMSQEFLLAFLALTARFHPKLVAHHHPAASTRPSNPLIASDYYAAVASERLSGIWNHDSHVQDIERTQAMLMLGLHDWGMCRGAKAWLTVGVAVRSAQAMGLQYELDLDDEPLSRSLALDAEAEQMGVNGHRGSAAGFKEGEDAFVQQEIRRRTFWSCYIMDRYLSSGKYRPQMLHAKELRIQLPASERSFLFAEKVRTLMLGEEQEHGVIGRAEVRSLRRASVMIGVTGSPEPSPKTIETDEDKGRLETGEEEGLVSRYIKILELYGSVMKWSCAGGRRAEKHPPWDHRSEFYQLRKHCLEFKAGLPRQHTLTPHNTQAHISLKTSTPYTLIHTLYLLIQIMLHREYTPFIPIRSSKPEGPLDPPLFPPDKYDVPLDFWEDSARELFGAARQIIDLVRNCQEWSALVETPIIGFAIYSVAFVGVYCINFPWMDPDGFMCTPVSAASKETSKPEEKPGESKGFEAARKSLEMLGELRSKIKLADGWFKTVNRMHKYFRRMKTDYRKNVAAMESTNSESEASPLSTRHLSLREGGYGGGLSEFKLLERTLYDFGNLEDQDSDIADERERPQSHFRPFDAGHDDSRSGTTVKSEEVENRPAAGSSDPLQPSRSESGPWNAINAIPASTSERHRSMPTPSNGQFRAFDYYDQAQQPSAQPPNYANDINNFRAAYPPNVANGPILSPASRTASTPTHPSPRFDQAQQPPNTWPAQNTTSSFPPQIPQGTYTTSGPYQPQSPIRTPGAYNPPSGPQQPQDAPTATLQGHPQPPQPWDSLQRQAFLDSLDTRIGGDDFAAFADGGDMGEWAVMAANRAYGGGWLSTIWEGAQ